MARIEDGDRRCLLPWTRARFGEGDSGGVGADMRARDVSGRERERRGADDAGLRGAGEMGRRWAVSAGLTVVALLLFFFKPFLFLITEFNLTFEIQFQIGSNQIQKFCKIKIISLNTLEHFP